MFSELGRDNRLLMLALFVWGLGEGLWLNIRQLYLVELGATPEQVGIALAIEAVVRSALHIPAGYLADRFGTYKIMFSSFVIGIIGPAIMALATSWTVAVPGMVIYAVSAFAIPAINAYALNSLPDKSLPGISDRAVTAVFAAYYAGLVISPWIGGIIADESGIRVTLWIGSMLFLVSTVVVGFARSVPPHPTEVDDKPRLLLRNGLFIKLTLFYILALLTVQVGFPLAPNFMQEVRGLSFQQIGLLLSILSAGTVLLNMLMGRISPRWNFVFTMAVSWLALFGIWRLPDLPGLALSFFALGGIATGRVLATAGVARVVRPRNRAFAFGVLESLLSIQMAAAAWIAGGLYGLTPAHDLPFIAGLICAPLAIICWFLLRLGTESVSQSLATQPANSA